MTAPGSHRAERWRAAAAEACLITPGRGSALLGFVQWVRRGTIAPIAGLGGERTAVPMAVMVIVLIRAFSVAALVAMFYRPGCRHDGRYWSRAGGAAGRFHLARDPSAWSFLQRYHGVGCRARHHRIRR